MNLPLVIAHISSGSIFVPLGIVALKRFRIASGLGPLLVLLVIALLCDLCSLLLLTNGVNTYPVGNFYLFAQFAILYYLFYNHLKRPAVLKWIFILFCTFYIANISFFQGPFIFNSITNVFASLIIMGFSLYYLYTLLKELPTVNIQRLPFLWISFAGLAYYGGNFFLFLFDNYLALGIDGSMAVLWVLHNLLNITKNILFAIGLWQAYRSMKLSF